MERKKFLTVCGTGCLGMMVAPMLLQSCMSTKFIAATLNGAILEFPISEFIESHKEAIKYRNYVITYHEKLKYPICVYRISEGEFKALLMRCTHQGTELQVFGDRLQCPAHGSEFSNLGVVKNGPAEESLRTFPVEVNQNLIKINLS